MAVAAFVLIVVVGGSAAALAWPRVRELLEPGRLHPLPPSWRKVSSPFGPRTHPVTGKQQFHNGTDYPAPRGTPIRSPEEGTVQRAWSDTRNGHALRVEHSSGAVTAYAHLDDVAPVVAGSAVLAGQYLGSVGMTGSATGYHLHFGVQRLVDGQWLDPEVWLKEGAGNA